MFGGALPEMKRRTGESNIQVLHEYACLAFYMEIHFPLHSLRRAEQSWIRFWGQCEEGDWPQDGKIEQLAARCEFPPRENALSTSVFPKSFACVHLLSDGRCSSVLYPDASIASRIASPAAR